MTMKDNGLVKLNEECGELVQIVAKKQACMDTDIHWDGKGSLKVRMEDELSDVNAASRLVIGTFDLDRTRIKTRSDMKLNLFIRWHSQLVDDPIQMIEPISQEQQNLILAKSIAIQAQGMKYSGLSSPVTTNDLIWALGILASIQ